MNHINLTAVGVIAACISAGGVLYSVFTNRVRIRVKPEVSDKEFKVEVQNLGNKNVVVKDVWIQLANGEKLPLKKYIEEKDNIPLEIKPQNFYVFPVVIDAVLAADLMTGEMVLYHPTLSEFIEENAESLCRARYVAVEIATGAVFKGKSGTFKNMVKKACAIYRQKQYTK